ncbi:protein kinase domain-containing protein [Paenarthrobacter sp. NCHU4564]|uniref:protein kinase domain-containing protein n=1 Tax=Paenarthrobacter sp. NCHU4564 TaxID=3451353 RepID=UPI003F987C47
MTVELKVEDSGPRPDLEGRTVTMDAVLADGEPRKIRFKLGERVGSGGSANVYRVEPPTWSNKTWNALNLRRGTPLVCKCEFEQSDLLRRRQLTLKALEEARAKSPEDLLGLVPLLAAGRREQRDTSSRIYLELMPHAGETLNHAINSDEWASLTHEQILLAFQPIVVAMANVHRIRPLKDPHGEITGHRDIKPSNTFVLFPEDPGFGQAFDSRAEQLPRAEGLPLLRVGDLGNLYTKSLDREATWTARPMRSRYWTAPEVLRYQNAAADVVARDVWSLGATLFFALTGKHPWSSVETWMGNKQDIADFEVALALEVLPDSDGFADLEATERGTAIAVLIRSCLTTAPESRPSMRDVMHEIDEITGTASSATEDRKPLRTAGSVPDSTTANEPAKEVSASIIRPLALIGIVILCLGLAGLALTTWMKSGTNGGSTPAASVTVTPSQPAGPETPAPLASPEIGRGGWGPGRTTYTSEVPADHAVLNSITNRYPQDATIDERLFLWVAGEDGKDSSYSVDVAPGDEISLVGFVANDAADNIRASKSLISNLTAELGQKGRGSQLGLYVSLEATTPGEPNDHSEVWAGVSVSSATPIQLQYVQNSFRVQSSSGTWSENGDVFGRGEKVKLGLKGPDGLLPVGSGDDVLYLYFKMKVIPDSGQ